METKETREEILKRVKTLEIRQQKRMMRGLEFSGAVFFMLLLVVIQHLPITAPVGQNTGFYGTLAYGAEAGAYILVGSICFVLGVIITLITLKKRGRNK